MSDGLLLVDKPRGPTSFDAVAAVRRRLGVKRVGHAGTLDPMASGLLPMLVGEATKLVPHLQDLDKEYLAEVTLGAGTDSYDAEGHVTSRAEPGALAAVDEAAVRALLPRFRGAIRQRPPAHSAIKQEGRRLYERARAGEVVEVPERDVMVHELELLAFASPTVRLRVRCGKGTYVRSIAHDLGAALGVGGHLVALRRTRVGPLEVAAAFDPFSSAPTPPLRPLADVVAHLGAFTIDGEMERRIRLGQQGVLAKLPAPDAAGGALRLLDGEGRLVAIAEPDSAAGWMLARVFAPVPHFR